MTARMSIANGRLKVQRMGVGRWVGGSVDVPLEHVVAVVMADRDSVRKWNKGVRLMGIQVPGVITSGLFRNRGQVTWWDMGRGSIALDVTFREEGIGRAIVQVDDPAAAIAELERAIAPVR